jgi:hypothetical protein
MVTVSQSCAAYTRAVAGPVRPTGMPAGPAGRHQPPYFGQDGVDTFVFVF